MVRRTLAVALVSLMAPLPLAASASAQEPGPFDAHRLSGTPEGGLTASARPTTTATTDSRPDLPATGADPLRLMLAGASLLGFGLALRLRVALADVRGVPEATYAELRYRRS